MKTACPHCTQHISIDPETHAELQGQEHFQCPACGGLVPVPPLSGTMPVSSVKTGIETSLTPPAPPPAPTTIAMARRGLNRNLLILGSAALLVLGGIGFFLASRQQGDVNTNIENVNNDIINNSYFQNLIATGTTSRTDLEAMALIRPYGDGFMGLSKETLNWKQAEDLAARTNGKIPSTDQSDPSWMGPPDTLENSLPSLAGTPVWLRERNEARVLDARKIIVPQSGGVLPRDMRHKVLLYWRPVGSTRSAPLEKAIAEWESLKYGMYVHWGPPTYQDVTLPPSMGFEPEQWAKVAKQAGMRYGILTVKHELGYCLWDSKDYPNDIGELPYASDLVGRFIRAFQAEGLKADIHYSVPDAFNEGKVMFQGPVSEKYFTVIKKQTIELHSQFLGISFHLFETATRLSASQRRELYELVHRSNTNCIIQWCPWEVIKKVIYYRGPAEALGGGCYEPVHVASSVMNDGWFLQDRRALQSAQDLFAQLHFAEVRRASFLLNVGPNTEGLIPPDQIRVLMELKELMSKGG